MKLIDILVEELPKRDGWPEGVVAITQDSDKAINNYKTADGLETNEHGTWRYSSAWEGYSLPASDSLCLASDYATAIITREQYEAALAAKNDGWIDWPGGKCPVEKGALIDVKWRDGKVDAAIPAKMRCPSRERQAIIWHHGGHELDIIAYRLYQPNEAEKVRASAWSAYAGITKADDEADLNECIGQDAAQVWGGEGLPPVGCICEISWAGDEWQQCEILFRSNQFVVVKLKESGMEDAYNIGDVIFRPIRPEEELKREEAIAKITDAICGEIPDTGMATAAKYAARAYDAIAAGKIPGLRLED